MGPSRPAGPHWRESLWTPWSPSASSGTSGWPGLATSTSRPLSRRSPRQLAMERAVSLGGDRAWFPQGARPVIALRIVTWNASALVHATLSKRKGKRAKLIELIRDLDVCLIQETHAGFEDVIVAFPELLRLFH
eukprot:11992891-Heterocapsa_arctica.AAC.1